jgi:CelD/BcsL family acetyltransferase involved in cellulose biosynthesis
VWEAEGLAADRRTTAIDVVEEIDAIETEWRQLADRTQAGPFACPGWFLAWWEGFGSGKLLAFVARRGDRLVGVAPMQLRRGALRAPANEHTPAFDLLASDDDARRALADALFARRARRVTIGPIEAAAASFGLLEGAARTAGYRSVVRPVGRAPFIRLASEVDAHERSLSHNLRHDVRRRIRRLCEAGTVSVEVSDGGARLEELLEEGFQVERKSWKGGAGTAIADNARARRFYVALSRWAATSGWLRLVFLRLDGRAIAFQLDLEMPPAYYSLKIGYDPDFERFSPGKVLTYSMVGRAVAAGASRYELLGTDEPWKYRFTTEGREQVTLHAFSPSLSGRLAETAFLRVRPIVRRLPLVARIAAARRR